MSEKREKMFVLYVYKNEICILKQSGVKYSLPSFVSHDMPANEFVEKTAELILGCNKKPLMIPSVRFIKCMKKYNEEHKGKEDFDLSFCAMIGDYDLPTIQQNNLSIVNLEDINKYPENFDGLVKIFVKAYLKEIKSGDFREFCKIYFKYT